MPAPLGMAQERQRRIGVTEHSLQKSHSHVREAIAGIQRVGLPELTIGRVPVPLEPGVDLAADCMGLAILGVEGHDGVERLPERAKRLATGESSVA